jgi:hypothetical protein
VVLDNGYISEATIQVYERQGIEPIITFGREAHHLDWHTCAVFVRQPRNGAWVAWRKISSAYMFFSWSKLAW